MKKDFVAPVLALTLVCLIMSGALALGNSITQPIIEEAAAERAENARRDIIPEADGFELLEIEMPGGVTEAYRATNGTGYIFMVSAYGYGGEIKMICGVDPAGAIIKSTVLAHNETQGLGTVVFDRAGEYEGRSNLENIDAIAGATITSNAYKNGIADALEAFKIIEGAES